MQTRTSRTRRPRVVAALALVVAVSGAISGAAAASTPDRHAKPHHGKLYRFSYDLVTASGAVKTFGGAGWWGSTSTKHLNAPMIGMAVLPNGLGYWLAGSDGGVFSFGEAKFYGSLGAKTLPSGHSIIAIVGTRSGLGYWLVDASGVVTPFGDALALGALPVADVKTPIVSVAISRDGKGAWFANAAGKVFTLGTAEGYGSPPRRTTLDHPITAMAATPDDKGYWLAEADGDVYPFGDAAKGKPAPARMIGSIVGMVPAKDALGYWATTDHGWVLPGGDAFSKGGVDAFVNGSPIVGIATTARWNGKLPAPVSPYPSGSIGYDVNWPQCAASGSTKAGTMPGPPSYPAGTMKYTVAIVGVDGWAADDYNSCLGAQVAWAKKAALPTASSKVPPYELYLFLNSPASTSTIDQTGPGGTCSKLAGTKWEHCLAYNYGYNSAKLAVQYATSQHATAGLWWLDVENDACAPGIYNQAGNGEFWSCDTSLNSLTIQGAIDDLRAEGITPGIYSTAIQYGGITGDYVPTGARIPIWIAGAYWTSPPYPASYQYVGPSANQPYCATSHNAYAFAGGRAVLLQETPGPNNYPYDPDYAC
jgi:hypothetical protein